MRYTAGAVDLSTAQAEWNTIHRPLFCLHFDCFLRYSTYTRYNTQNSLPCHRQHSDNSIWQIRLLHFTYVQCLLTGNCPRPPAILLAFAIYPSSCAIRLPSASFMKPALHRRSLSSHAARGALDAPRHAGSPQVWRHARRGYLEHKTCLSGNTYSRFFQLDMCIVSPVTP